jgi:hypothetical protein
MNHFPGEAGQFGSPALPLVPFPCLLRQSNRFGCEGRTAKPKLARHPLGGLKDSVNPV